MWHGDFGYADTNALDELERKLAAAERDFAEADLERRIEELRAARISQVSAFELLSFGRNCTFCNALTSAICFFYLQNQLVRDYEEELARLRLDVDNVEAIKEALPDGCWKRLKLEP